MKFANDLVSRATDSAFQEYDPFQLPRLDASGVGGFLDLSNREPQYDSLWEVL